MSNVLSPTCLALLRWCAALATGATACAQESVEQRLDRIERENRVLRERIDRLAGATTGAGAGAEQPAGTPQGFRKAYAIDEGVSLAGYGEFLFTQNSGRTDVADALRTVLYFGYRFDRKWLFHGEVELEHGSTTAASGTTAGSGEVSLEFGYLEHQFDERLALRAGMLLMPVGLVNEQHEPTMFLPAARAQTETRILPSTWREIGIEAVGTFDDLDVRLFVGTGLDGEEFDHTGLRGGRQKGNREAADDIATAVRLDQHVGSLLIGGSATYQRAGQDGLRGQTPIPELDTVIAEAHVDWRPGAWIVRAVCASAWSDDAHAFAVATGRNLAERSYGAYGELGWDVMSWCSADSKAAVIPFVRWERIDTQAEMPEGIAADRAQASTIVTFGVHWRPIEPLVFKCDFEAWDDSYDRFNLAMGYVF